jgi:hypothetical protein
LEPNASAALIWDRLADPGHQMNLDLQEIPGRFEAERRVAIAQRTSARNASSSSIGTRKARARTSLAPGSAPTTT